MPEEPTAPPRSPRRRVPSARRFAAGALASFVAIFGVLALRVHDGDDPALANVATTKASSSTTTTTTTTSTDPYDSSSTSSDPYDSGDDSGSSDDGSSSSDDASGAVSSTPGASTSAS